MSPVTALQSSKSSLGREGSVVMEFLVTSSEQPHDMLENALQTQLPPGITDVELGEIHVHEGK